MSGLRVRHLSLTYPGSPPVAALREVDLDVGNGEIVAVLGPSGCGKTTLLRVIAGLERPGAGRVEMDETVFDSDGTHLPPERRGIGLVPQEGALFPHLDVAGNVGFGLRRVDREQRRARVEELLSMVGLEGLGARGPADLSGGQQQRAALARALAPRPKMVLLDEPFSALDSGLRTEVRLEVTRLLRAAGTTALVVTHDQSEALEMADSIAVMRDGHVVQFGPPAELYRRPVDVWVGTFLGDAITMPGEVVGSVVHSALGTLELAEPATDGAATVFLRPEQLQRSSIDGRTDGTHAFAKVLEIRFRGHEAAVDLDLPGVTVTARWPSEALPEPGTEVGLEVIGPVLAFPS